jgi:hypothetical protein
MGLTELYLLMAIKNGKKFMKINYGNE